MWGLHGLPVECLFSLCPNPLVLTVALRAPVSLKFLWVLTPDAHIWGSSGPEILALPPEGRLENHQLEIADGQRRTLGQGPGTRDSRSRFWDLQPQGFTESCAFDGLSAHLLKWGALPIGCRIHFHLAM